MDEKDNENNISHIADEKKIPKANALYEKICYVLVFILSILIFIALYIIYGQTHRVIDYRYGSLQMPFNKKVLKCQLNNYDKQSIV